MNPTARRIYERKELLKKIWMITGEENRRYLQVMIKRVNSVKSDKSREEYLREIDKLK